MTTSSYIAMVLGWIPDWVRQSLLLDSESCAVFTIPGVESAISVTTSVDGTGEFDSVFVAFYGVSDYSDAIVAPHEVSLLKSGTEACVGDTAMGEIRTLLDRFEASGAQWTIDRDVPDSVVLAISVG